MTLSGESRYPLAIAASLLLGCSPSGGAGDSPAASAASGASSGSAGAGGAGGASSSSTGPGVTAPNFADGFFDLTEGLALPFDIPKHPDDQKWVIDTAALFVDLDADGVSEVIFTHATPAPGGGITGDFQPKVYRYVSGQLELVGPFAADAFPSTYSFIPRAVIDLDGDGLLDVITSSQVAWGKPGGAFASPVFLTDINDKRGPVDTLAIADLDDDGWLDVLIGGALCQSDGPPLFPVMRTGLRAFANAPTLIDQPIPGRSFAVLSAKIGGERIISSLFSSCFLPDVGDPYPFYHWSGDAFVPFELLPATYTVKSPMGAALGDLDGDGVLDFTISDRHDYFRGGTLPLEDISEKLGFQDIPSESLIPMIPWGVALLDLDRDERLDIVTVHGNDFKAWFDPGWKVGPQWSTVHWNAGDLAFIEVEVGLSRKGQWKALAVGDIDSDGDADLAIGAGDELPRIYRNDIALGHGLSLRFHGTTSNPLGIGAIVDVETHLGDAKRRFLVGNYWSPSISSEPLVFVGLGEAESAARVTVTWPSGVVQELLDLAAGTLHPITEPLLFAVTPKERHLPADSVSKATLTVSPRNPDGSPKTAVVTVSLTGPGSIASVVQSGTDWTIEVLAPGAPGSSVVDVLVDGVASGIHPRIFWD